MNGKITCRHHCVAPKRHVGCHDHCPEYLEQKAALEKHKEKERADRAIDTYDYERMASYARWRQRQASR